MYIGVTYQLYQRSHLNKFAQKASCNFTISWVPLCLGSEEEDGIYHDNIYVLRTCAAVHWILYLSCQFDLDGLCIAPSIFANDSGTGITGYSNTFWRSKSDMALRYNSRPRRSLLPVNSMIFSLSCDLTLLLTASLVNVFSFRLEIGFWKRSSSLRHSSLNSSHHVRPIATQLTRSSLTSTLTFLPETVQVISCR